MRIRSLLVASALALLAACSGDKYPYPPQFVGVEDVSMRSLPVPAPRYSAAYNAEIDQVIARQARLTDAQKTTISVENHIAPEMIVAPVLGKRYTAERYPALYTLLKHAASDAWRISDATQEYWGALRPWMADARVALLVPSITRPGYPSGHTVTNTVWAQVLAELFPAKRHALFARAMAVGNHRVDGGAHFPRDVEAGQKLATIIYTEMKADPQFMRELAAARREVQSRARAPITPRALSACNEQSGGMSACLGH